jgi:hypothetical protein
VREDLGKQEPVIRAAIARFMATLERDPADGAGGLYQRASKAFPELGYYPCVYPGDDPSGDKASLADAADDLADIAGDLVEVLWHFDNSTPEEAVWEYRFGYQHHWGDHLHGLRNYLHSSRIAAW